MADDGHDEKQDRKAELKKFKDELREACDTAMRGKTDAIRAFFCNRREIPKEFKGNSERTYGFLHATTILRTFGPDEGIDILLKAGYESDAEAAYCVVAGMNVDFGNKRAAGILVRRDLANHCKCMEELITRLIRLDSDPGQHHSLMALVEECKWCAREVCGKKERK